MSLAAVKDKVYSVLIADAVYRTLLGNPDVMPYRTYYLRPPTQPSFPFVVFWLRPQTFSKVHAREILSSVVQLSVNVWDQAESEAAQHEEIMQRIIRLLHQVPQDTGFRAILTMEPQELADEEVNATGLNAAFDLHYRRSLL